MAQDKWLTPYVYEGVKERKGKQKQKSKGKVSIVAHIDLNRVMEMYGQEVARRVAAETRLEELTLPLCTIEGEAMESEWQEEKEEEE